MTETIWTDRLRVAAANFGIRCDHLDLDGLTTHTSLMASFKVLWNYPDRESAEELANHMNREHARRTHQQFRCLSRRYSVVELNGQLVEGEPCDSLN